VLDLSGVVFRLTAAGIRGNWPCCKVLGQGKNVHHEVRRNESLVRTLLDLTTWTPSWNAPTVGMRRWHRSREEQVCPTAEASWRFLSKEGNVRLLLSFSSILHPGAVDRFSFFFRPYWNSVLS